MSATILIFSILALPVVIHCYSDQWLHKIYVDNMTGVNDTSCWEGGYSTPCLSINLALEGAQYYKHSITILLQPGQHQLHNNGSDTQLKNISQLAIVGNGSEGEIVIKCQPLAGLAFFQSREIELKNIEMIGCGAIQNSTSRYANRYSLPHLNIQVALFFQSCTDVYLNNAHIIKSNGTGAAFYNPVGVVYIDSCQLMHNGLSCKKAAMLAGGGGLVIEANDITSQSSYTITNSNFTNNTASSGHFASVGSGYLGLGRGGGISVVFRGTATNNTVQLNNVRLEGNMAQFGAGLFLALYGNTSNNTVSIDDVKVMENKALETSHGTLLPSTSGGGALIELATTGPDYPSDNTINITSSRFVSNAAEIGGGLTVSTVFDSEFFNADNKLIIENCNFDNNKAFQGSSVYLTQSDKSQQSILDTKISDSNFTNGHCGDTLTHGLPCSSSVLLRFFSLTLMGVSVFTGNSVSALSLRSSSSIELLSSTHLQFISNSAVDGAALHIVDCSSLVVNSGTTLLFKNNTASHHGGAIYSESCTFQQTGGRDCFIRHSNTTLHPEEWNITVTFTENRAAGLGDAIYTDSIQSCIWPDQHSLGNDKHVTFCWENWLFLNKYDMKDKCVNQLRSGPSYYVGTGRTQYALYPGECIDLSDFSVRDDWGNDITDIKVDHSSGLFSLFNSSDPGCSCFIPNLVIDDCVGENYDCGPNEVSIVPDCNLSYTNYNSTILIHPHQLTDIVLNITLKYCLNCNLIHQYCRNENQFNPVCNNCPDDNLFEPLLLCGSCSDQDYGVAINDPQYPCVKCESSGVAIFIFLQLVPGLIMMVLLTVLHVNITNGNLNGYVLFSQIISLRFLVQSLFLSQYYSQFLLFLIPLIVYSIWNLNFLIVYPFPFCLPYVNTAVRTILLQYVIAVYPLLFIVVSYIWMKCYNNGYRLVVTITRPVHRLLARFWQKFNINPSLIDTYAGLILLSYMRFLAVSVKLLQLIVMDLQSSNKHLSDNIALAVLAVLCLLVFVVLPMTFLLLNHLKVFQQCLTCCKLDRPGLHALVDAYQGCFKNSATDGSERRYFAGIYLLFRFCYVAIFGLSTLHEFIIISQPILCFVMTWLVVILQPYKKTAHNVIDFLLLFAMTVASSVSSLLNPISNIESGYVILPFLVLFIYIIYRLLRSCCCVCMKRRRRETDQDDEPKTPPSDHDLTTTAAASDDYIEDDLYADRILNPDGYKKIN